MMEGHTVGREDGRLHSVELAQQERVSQQSFRLTFVN